MTAMDLEMLRITLSSIGDAVIATDSDWRITFLNPVAESLVGWSHEEAVRLPLSEVFHSIDERTREPTESPIAHVLRVGTSVEFADRTLLVSRDGVERPIEDSAAPIRDGKGKLMGVVVVFRDASKRREEERRLGELLVREQAVREQAEKANHLKDEFLATLSHELRTPLGAITAWVKLLQQPDVTAAESAHGLEVIERNVRAQTQLISDLLDVSRIMSGKMSLDLRPVDVPRVVEAAADSVRQAARAKGIDLRCRLDPGATLALGDATRLQQVVWNVLQNSIKFTPDGGWVELCLEREAKFVLLTVSDSGVGVAPASLPHLFERFWQADGTTTRVHRGLGLGLAIVHELVELHGGTVQLDSAGESRGSTVTIRLPRQHFLTATADSASVAAEVAKAPRTSGRSPLQGLSVLLVEDDDDSREVVRIVLKRHGAEVIEARSVPEALEQLRVSVPDVLISDIGMPGEDGYSLLRKLRALPENEGGRVPALALTAFARRQDHDRALQDGFQLHLTKPVSPSALSAAVAHLAGR